MSKRYTDEFKQEAIRQVQERGYSVADVSERLGICSKSLYAWLSKSKKQATCDNSSQLEIARLKAQLKRVEEERDILKKATAHIHHAELWTQDVDFKGLSNVKHFGKA